MTKLKKQEKLVAGLIFSKKGKSFKTIKGSKKKESVKDPNNFGYLNGTQQIEQEIL